MEKTPKLGILGGMGPQATISFYQMVMDNTLAACDQDHLPAVILSDTLMPDRTGAILSGDTEPPLRRLIQDARQLEENGCTVIVIPCNTAHYFVPQVQQAVGIPILHMLRETAEHLHRLGRRRPGILATDGTVRTELYQQICKDLALQPLLPDAEGQAGIMKLIYDRIKAGLPGLPEHFLPADRSLRQQGCDCIILGCTELSVYALQAGLDDFYVDPMEILARRAVTFCQKPLRPNPGLAF